LDPDFDSMVLSTSPRKAVPLASGDDWDQSSSSSRGPSVTRRAFFCGVVVESEGGNPISEGSSNLQHIVVLEVDILHRCSRTRCVVGRTTRFTI
jgi:hypothetical protein